MSSGTDSAAATWAVSEEAAAFLRRQHGLWIDGQERQAEHGAQLDVLDPATGEVITAVAAASAADMDAAVAAARAAFRDRRWAGLAPYEREQVMRKLADLLLANAEELAQLDTLDNGMPLTQSRAEIESSAAHLRYFAGRAAALSGGVINPYRGGSYTVSVRREAIGVIGAITAWNVPLDNAVWKIGAALASGNSIVLKPAEETPLSTQRLAALAGEAGIPPGVLNVVTGTGEIAGAALSAHPDVDRIAFTGSTETGRRIVSASAGNLKRVTLELGGKSPAIVMPDADLDRYAEQIVAAVMFNAGQICTAGSRAYVHHDILGDFTQLARDIIDRLHVAPGFDHDAQVGPVVSRAQMERVLGYIAAGEADGAVRTSGGQRAAAASSAGYFVMPTLFSDVRDTMRISREEIFGPVISVLEFSDLDDAVHRANDSRYGLAAGVWTSNVGTAHRLAQRLEAGTVWVNCYNKFDPAVPFGGYKQSGYGRELGEASLEECTNTKTVWIGLE